MRLAFLPYLLLCMAFIPAIPNKSYAAAKSGPPIPVPEMPDSTRLPIPLPFFSKVGFQTGFVNTKNLDTGVNFGTLLSKDAYHDFLEITSTFHLWGATNDTLDVATAGVDMNFTYKIPIRWGWYGYAGFVLGYGFVHEEKSLGLDGKPMRKVSTRHEFLKFVTVGAEFDLHSNRTLFVQLKYGVTNLSPEVHIYTGLNFYTKYKKFMPWLAPPLMRD